MNDLPKPRADSKLKTLPEDRQGDIYEHSIANTLAETVEWLKANGIDTSTRAVSDFLAWYRLCQQQARNEMIVKELLSDHAKRNPELSSERVFEAGQTFFSGLALASQDPKTWFLAQQTALRKAKFHLATQKYNDLKQLLDASQAPGGLTPETVKKIENELRLR